MGSDPSLVLTVAQLRLCLNVLEPGRWDDLPMVDAGGPAEQQLMNAFLELVQAGRFLPEEDGFSMDPGLEAMLEKLLHPVAVYRVLEGQRISELVYQDGQGAVSLTPASGLPGCCVLAATDPPVEQIWRLEPEEHRQMPMDLETLALFFQGKIETEVP